MTVFLFRKHPDFFPAPSRFLRSLRAPRKLAGMRRELREWLHEVPDTLERKKRAFHLLDLLLRDDSFLSSRRNEPFDDEA